jgi:phospholipid/cholesterol/gamma-HCH transport system substrate-binding protein
MFKLLRYIDWSELSGLLVGAVLAIAICVATTILVAKLYQEGILGKKEYHLYSNMPTAQGLSKGTKVQISGVDVGRIEDITIADSGSVSFVKLKLTIDVKYQERITDKSVVFVTRDQNIISERVVNIDISQKGNRILENEEYLITGRAQDIENVLKTANELIDQLNKLIVIADTLLNKVIDTNATIGMLLGSRILYDRLDNVVSRLDKAFIEVNGLVGNANGMFSSMNEAMPKAMAFADTLSTGVMGFMGSLNNLTDRATTLITSLDTTAHNVGNMVNDLNSMVGSAGNIITDGSQAINKADDVLGGVSKFWFMRSKIPKKDTIPLLEDTW